MNKTLFLASFIFKGKVNEFIKKIQQTLGVNEKLITLYEDKDDNTKTIITYKFELPEYEKINFREIAPNTIPIHKKGKTLYTINALNKLIEQEHNDHLGNIDFKSIKIDWDEYNDKFILIHGGELKILSISKILS